MWHRRAAVQVWGLSNGGKAEKRQRQDRKRLHYIPIEQVRVLNGRGVCLVVTIADRVMSRSVDPRRQPFSKPSARETGRLLATAGYSPKSFAAHEQFKVSLLEMKAEAYRGSILQ